jgi:RsiW-degrading membrane proteinase PrsW (M82 family)
LVAVPCTAAAMIVVLACYLWLDRWEPEPTRLLLLAFLWGATVAVVVSLVLELATNAVLGTGLVLTVAAPAIEEAAKGAFLLVMLTGVRRQELHGVVDGLVYAGFTAVGFAFIEDIGYIAQSFGHGTTDGVVTVILRLVLAPFAHPLFTSMTGIGIGLAVSRPRGLITYGAPTAGYVAAVALHALWNGSTSFGLAGYLFVYVVIMVPVFVLAVLWARHHRRLERDIVTRQLPAMVYNGWITPAEAQWLASIAARRAWLKAVRLRTGATGVRALRAFQASATELAFLRDRVERGGPPPPGSSPAYYLHAELVDALARNRALAQAPLHALPPPRSVAP